MRRWIGWTAVILLVVAAPGYATTITMHNDSPQYWGKLTVDFDDKSDWTVGAGRFYTTVGEGEHQIDTFSYGVDSNENFNWNTPYAADFRIPNGDYREAAWLVSCFDPFVGTYWSDHTYDSARQIVMTLQLAIWESLYDDHFDPSESDKSILYGTMRDSIAAIGGFDSGRFRVAKIDGHQDQLVAAPVPEPATMMLMGIGLLGLGIVGRKRLK